VTEPSRNVFLLTGVTGFLGKVMLHELIRRTEELRVGRIVVPIRPLRGLTPNDRFRREVRAARCFADLPAGWDSAVTVLPADVTRVALGLDAAAEHDLRDVTHVIHAAASIKFHLAVSAAARVNVTASLNVLELARTLPALRRMVYVSTAYVRPDAAGGPIEEAPASLPDTPQRLLDACLTPDVDEARLLAAAGHPNSYTLTKAIAEGLLVERRGGVPLSIVRPSVITAARRHPMPGWIDSSAGFAGFVVAVGAGHLRALVCDPDARLDLIPVDEVSHRVIRAAVEDREPVTIRHAVVGMAQSATIGEGWDAIQRYFAMQPVDRDPAGRQLGPRGLRFRVADALRHRLPVIAARLGSKGRRRQAEKRAARLASLNDEFTYFTTQSFDFRTSWPIDASFDGRAFVTTVDRGVHEHLFKHDRRRWPLAGRAHRAGRGVVRWAVSQPVGNGWIRGAAALSRVLLRRTTSGVTVDLPSFERALESVPSDATLVLAPSHRSYLDFVLCAYLAFARPDLLPLPHFAATTDFARIPGLGRVLAALHAFYIRRGGGPDPELAPRVAELLDRGRTMAFFIEGARSRTGDFLEPKRGLLRCLQATGRRCALLPIAISYERVPEQDAFDRELAGSPRPTMRVGPLLGWIARAWRRQVDLGRIHIAAAEPVILDRGSDVHAVSHQVIDHLRSAMVPLRPPSREPERPMWENDRSDTLTNADAGR
jgi:fatty acyl-CoA reductase